jgi:hypothetical protein
MWRRKATGVAAIAAGVVLFVAGLADHVFAAPKAALCQSGLGQFVQDMDGTVAHDCGLVTTLEAATGWLLIAGVLIAVRPGVLVEPDLNLALAAVTHP